MTRTTLAVAADYADAMLVARRWKNILFLLLLLFLLIQIGIFFGVRYYGGGSISVSAGPDATQPAVHATRDLTPGAAFVTNTIDFLTMVCVIVLAVVLLLVVIIMLVGRLIGVTHV